MSPQTLLHSLYLIRYSTMDCRNTNQPLNINITSRLLQKYDPPPSTQISEELLPESPHSSASVESSPSPVKLSYQFS